VLLGSALGGGAADGAMARVGISADAVAAGNTLARSGAEFDKGAGDGRFG
jgi:hypothetical protein